MDRAGMESPRGLWSSWQAHTHAPTGTRTCSRYAVDRGSWRTKGELDKGLHARKARKIGSKDGRPRMTVSVSADLSRCRRRTYVFWRPQLREGSEHSETKGTAELAKPSALVNR